MTPEKQELIEHIKKLKVTVGKDLLTGPVTYAVSDIDFGNEIAEAIADAWLDSRNAQLLRMRDQFAVWLMEPDDKDEIKLSDVVAYFDAEIATLTNKDKEK